MLTEGIDLQRDGQQSSKAARVKMMQEIKNKDNERSEGREEGDALIAMAFRMRDMGSMRSSNRRSSNLQIHLLQCDRSHRNPWLVSRPRHLAVQKPRRPCLVQ